MKRARIIGLAGLICASAITGVFLLRQKEPTYQGRSLSRWLKIYRERTSGDWDAQEINDAIVAVRTIGTNAFPCLLDWIASSDAGDTNAVIATLRHLPSSIRNLRFVNAIENAPYERCYNATAGFEILGPIADPAAPRLAALLKRAGPEASQAAADVLAGMGQSGLDLLLKELATPGNTNVTIALAVASRPRIGTNALAAFDFFVHNLDHTNAVIANLCCGGLCSPNFDPGLVVAELGSIVRNESAPAVRRVAALKALGRLTQRAQSAVPVIVEAMSAPDTAVRSAATNALERVKLESNGF